MSLIKVIKGRTIRKVMGGGKTKKKIIPREKLGEKIFPGIVQKKSPCWEDRPINFT